jgi:hypothetical protein
MSSFPASHLSAYEIGKRIKAITLDGATVTDTLIKITTYLDREDKVRLFLHFKNALPTRSEMFLDQRGFEMALDQHVKRVAE